MIKVTDYIVKWLAEYGVKHVFMVTGGGAMHLNDSFGKFQDRIKIVCNHHEQACAIAAEGYSRTSGKLAVVNVTTGPGGLNTLTGLMGQWTDSVPVLYLSGQVKFETTVMSCPELSLRQLGDQEINIVDIVKSLTKFAIVLKNPDDIKKILEQAVLTATHGRPGPVWIDIPMNAQGALIDEDNLQGYDDVEDDLFDKNELITKTARLIKLLQTTKRPVIVAGHGIRISNSQELLFKLIERLKIPVLTTFNGFDLVPNDYPYYIGRIGTLGNRAGNFALQNSDLLISIGSRNNIRQVSYNWENFARAAKKVVIDIDFSELKKNTLISDIPIHADAGIFLKELLHQLERTRVQEWKEWLSWGLERKSRFPIMTDDYLGYKDSVNPYYFMYILTKLCKENTIIVAGNGTACVSLFHSGIVKKNQRIFWNSGCAAMGYDLPASIGASFASGKREVICLAGDGSLQMNIQELATVAYHKLPVKLFYLNNGGYSSIKQTQDNFFGRRTGTDETTGLGFPDIKKIAAAYGLPMEMINDESGLEKDIKRILCKNGPVVCEVMLPREYEFKPKLSSEKKPDGRIISKPLEDMYPFLKREEFFKNMIIPILKE